MTTEQENTEIVSKTNEITLCTVLLFFAKMYE